MTTELPVFDFDEIPDERAAELFLFMQKAGVAGTIVYRIKPSTETAIADNKTYLKSIGFKEVGALKDDMLIKAARGATKTNYGSSKKKECNFTLLKTGANNINKAIASDGKKADLIVLDAANGLIHELRLMELESGVTIQGTKQNEVTFKTTGDSFRSPLKSINIVGADGTEQSLPMETI